MGWFGINNMNNSIDKLGEVAIPSLVNLELIKVKQLEIKAALRTLTSRYLLRSDVERQYANIAASREGQNKAMEEYSKLEATEKEKELYKIFLNKIEISRKYNNELIELSKGYLNDNVDKEKLSEKITSLGVDGDARVAFDEMMVAADNLLSYAKEYYGRDLVRKSINSANVTIRFILTVTAVSFVVAVLLGIFLALSISKPVTKITANLFNASKNLESASYQVSSSSQELSSGSAELASSVEEITSSLEELQSVVESNTKSVTQSEGMMKETTRDSQAVTDKMDELKTALNEIASNSKNVEKIIKVIDDIAFQTNILALNAAVEAARAGDAGRGFAVVAEQVKDLAQKSANAAKETAQLIENAIESIQNGERLGGEVIDSQKSTGEKAVKVSTLLDEINRASQEQLKGINQITQAISQTNSIVQQTASSSEENAAAGEELMSQAETLNNIVENLNIIITGKASLNKNGVSGTPHIAHTKSPMHEQMQQVNAHLDKSRMIPLNTTTPHAAVNNESGVAVKKLNPETQIPFDDFSEF